MDVWQYLHSANPVAQWVISILSIIFLLWLASLLYWLARLMQQRLQMKRCDEVSTLAEALRSLGNREDDAAGGEDEERARPARGESADGAHEAAFERFCKEKSLRPDSLVARHIRAIYEAGHAQSRLEIGELIKHTANGLLRGNGLLRSLLGTFIVFGLLGTLFGLADSLAQLSPLTPGSSGTSQQMSENVSQGLGQLLAQLKSAFAPSICGIAFTIAGLIIFTLYVHLVCNPVRNLLERLTLTVWVPQLFPNTTQRLQSALRVTEGQIRKNLASIERVALFSHEIQGRMDALNKSFDSAGKALKLLERASAQIDTFADRFVKGIGGLTSFQEELRTLYRQMADDSKSFHDSLRGNVERSEEFHQKSRELIEGQGRQLESVLSALKLFEEGYLASREKLDRSLEEVLTATRKAFEGIGQRNEEVVQALGVPLRKELGESLGAIATTLDKDLGAIAGTLTVQLKGIQDEFRRFDGPITTAAQQIENTMETVVRRTDALTQQLHREILGQDEKNRKQLEHLGALNERIAALLQALSKFQEAQNAQFPEIGRRVGDLSQNVATLGSNLQTFGQNFSPGGSDGKQFELLREQNAKVVAGLERLFQSINLLRDSVAIPPQYPDAAPRAPFSVGEERGYRPPPTRHDFGRRGSAESQGTPHAADPFQREGRRSRVPGEAGAEKATDNSGGEETGVDAPDGETHHPRQRVHESVRAFTFMGEDGAEFSHEKPSRLRILLSRLRHPFRRS